MRTLSFLILSALLPVAAQASTDAERWAFEHADYLRALSFQEGRATLASKSSQRLDELDDPALTRVTQEFGATVIEMDKLPFRTARVNSDKKVWSSYWFPHYEREIFESPTRDSVLEKYDLYRSDLRRIVSKAAPVQKERFSVATARWEGLCDSWSIAAVLLPEPSAPNFVRIKEGMVNVWFTVGDLKALLLKSFENVSSASFKIYGQRLHAGPSQVINGQSFGWVQPDLYPDQFHRFLEVVLFEQKKAFVLDHDPSEAVWSEPVDGGNFEILPIPGRTDQVFVRAYIYPAKQLTRETKDKVGKNEHIREYNYILGGTLDWNRNLKVEYGIWLNKDFVKNAADYKNNADLQNLVRVDSRRSHPDYVIVVPESVINERKPANPEIDTQIVDFLVKPRQ